MKTLASGKDATDAKNLLTDTKASPQAEAEPVSAKPTTSKRFDLMGRFSLLYEMSTLLDHPVTPQLNQIKCPVLFLHGDDDKVVGPGGSVTMHRNCPGSTLKLIPGPCGHIVLTVLPDVAKKEILDFVGLV